MVKIVAAAKTTDVVTVKPLAAHDAVNLLDAYLKGMIKEAFLVIQTSTMAD